MSSSNVPLVVTMGDPAGCGPQITTQTWLDRDALDLAPFFVISDPRVYERDVPVQTIEHPRHAADVFETALPVLPFELPEIETLKPGVASGRFATSIIESIERATALCMAGDAAAMVTNPIAKSVLYEEGFAFPGHTEFISSLCQGVQPKAPHPIMMLVGGGLRVALATIHVPLMKVLDHLTIETLTQTAKITHRAMVEDFGLTDPKIAFTGLNPHAGENGAIGTEERDIINPAASELRSLGLNVSDARPGDTVFYEALNGQFDAVIAMTHDQGLIPVKTLDMWGGVNTTLGLPILRTSPDHGTAYDAAAAGQCRPDSLIAALRLAAELADNRARAHA
ncbi:MAG: 4-hydroxythreonine-4-phosphate dehydrogenase PdxA [Pseudomonadota bacterium]